MILFCVQKIPDRYANDADHAVQQDLLRVAVPSGNEQLL